MELRAEPRFQISAPSRAITLENPDRELECRVIDISATGMRFVADEGLYTDEVMILDVEDHLVLVQIRNSQPRGDKFAIGARRIHALHKALLPEGASRIEQVGALLQDLRYRPPSPMAPDEPRVEATIEKVLHRWDRLNAGLEPESESAAPAQPEPARNGVVHAEPEPAAEATPPNKAQEPPAPVNIELPPPPEPVHSTRRIPQDELPAQLPDIRDYLARPAAPEETETAPKPKAEISGRSLKIAIPAALAAAGLVAIYFIQFYNHTGKAAATVTPAAKPLVVTLPVSNKTVPPSKEPAKVTTNTPARPASQEPVKVAAKAPAKPVSQEPVKAAEKPPLNPAPSAARPAPPEPVKIAANTPPKPAATASVSVTHSSATPAPATTKTAPAATPVQARRTSAGPHRVQLRAMDASWVAATVDGKPVYAKTMSKDETQELDFSQIAWLHIGNVNGVELSLDGTPVNLKGGRPMRLLELTPGGFKFLPWTNGDPVSASR